ncbi:MAG TPA: rhomboid family intramembrane serine protease, partial [Aggregatilineales bacterium]|nr:rhomboid family intramembrane serine protease [Aggregatilineales bacterium]
MQNNEPLPDFQQEQAAPQPIRIRFPLIQPNMAYAIIFVLVLVHLYVSQLNPFEQNDFYLKYSNFAVYVAQGEYYRLFTSMFLHAPGLMHLGFNSLALYAFGKDIESLFGHVRFTLIYFLGGLAGSVTSFAITRSNSIGASGAVFAVFGALVAYYYQNRQLYGAAAAVRLRQLGMLALVNLGI